MDEWWGREGISALAQPLFFEHFASTSVLEEGEGGLHSFLIAFDSADEPESTYIHIVGVRPDLRGPGRGAALYRRTFDEASRVQAPWANDLSEDLAIKDIDTTRRVVAELRKKLELNGERAST